MRCVSAGAAPREPWRTDSASARLTGAGSRYLRGILTGPKRTGRTLACFPSAAYIEVPGRREPRVLALVTPHAVRLPNAVLLTGAPPHPLAALAAGDTASVGADGVELDGLRVRVSRWWDPAPRLSPVSPAIFATGVETLRAVLGRDEAGTNRHGLGAHRVAHELADSCAAGELARAAEAAERLVGLGPGLTPSGDDMLCGLLLGLRAAGHALPGGETAVWLAGRLAAAVTSDAETRTTRLAATLLDCAAHGLSSAETTAVLRALAGHQPVEPAAARLLAVGHTSGADLAWGLVTGCSAALRLSR